MSPRSTRQHLVALGAALTLTTALTSCSLSSAPNPSGDQPTTNLPVVVDTGDTADYGNGADSANTPDNSPDNSNDTGTNNAPASDDNDSAQQPDTDTQPQFPEANTVKAIPSANTVVVDNTFGWTLSAKGANNEYTVLLPKINDTPSVGSNIVITSSQRGVKGLVGTVTRVADNDHGIALSVAPAPIREAYDTFDINKTVDLTDAVTSFIEPMDVNGTIDSPTRIGTASINDLPWQCNIAGQWQPVADQPVDFSPTVTIKGRLGRDAFAAGNASLDVTTSVTTTIHSNRTDGTECRLDPEAMATRHLLIPIPDTPFGIHLGLNDTITVTSQQPSTGDYTSTSVTETIATQNGEALQPQAPFLTPATLSTTPQEDSVITQVLNFVTTVDPLLGSGVTETPWTSADEARQAFIDVMRTWNAQGQPIAAKGSGLQIDATANTTSTTSGGHTSITGSMDQTATVDSQLLGYSTPGPIETGGYVANIPGDDASDNPETPGDDTRPDCGPNSKKLAEIAALPAVDTSDYLFKDLDSPGDRQIWFMNADRTLLCFGSESLSCDSITEITPHPEDKKPPKNVEPFGQLFFYDGFFVDRSQADLGIARGGQSTGSECEKMFSNWIPRDSSDEGVLGLTRQACDYRRDNVHVLPRGKSIDLGSVVCADTDNGLTCLNKDKGVGITWSPDEYELVCRGDNPAYSYHGKSIAWKGHDS